jgi:hypothetical protein
MTKNPFQQIVEKLDDNPVELDVPYLNWVGGLLEDHNILPKTYGDILSVLEYLHEHKALTLNRNEEDDTYTIRKYNG